ncbi:hypothetical protein D7V83_13925 [bacterium 0.1xD8-71]|nr:hypothetical protein D7V83_13925 [bacterium 0.1xD8-71]
MILTILETMGHSKCKSKRIVTIMMLVILCTACQSEKKDKEADKKVDFRIIRKLYIYTEQRNEIEIYYPQLSGLEDTAKEKRINTLIEEDVKKVIGEKNKEGDDTLYCINLDFEDNHLKRCCCRFPGTKGYAAGG